jgi:hypothetical protein
MIPRTASLRSADDFATLAVRAWAGFPDRFATHPKSTATGYERSLLYRYTIAAQEHLTKPAHYHRQVVLYAYALTQSRHRRSRPQYGTSFILRIHHCQAHNAVSSST